VGTLIFSHFDGWLKYPNVCVCCVCCVCRNAVTLVLPRYSPPLKLQVKSVSNRTKSSSCGCWITLTSCDSLPLKKRHVVQCVTYILCDLVTASLPTCIFKWSNHRCRPAQAWMSPPPEGQEFSLNFLTTFFTHHPHSYDLF